MPRERAASECRAVVAGGMGDHAARGLHLVQRPDRIAGTAELERTAALQVFGLEAQARPTDRIQFARAQDRGQRRMRRDSSRGGQDLGSTGQGGITHAQRLT
jgi:hypothetical protein